MPVTVRLPTVLRRHANGESLVQAEGENVREVIANLIDTFPEMGGQVLAEDGELHRFVNVYLNDDDIRYLERLSTKVADGDTVSILPAVAGGL